MALPNPPPPSLPSQNSAQSRPHSPELVIPRPHDTTGPHRRCDLFCTVIDNFGDAAVCWRLARQLAREHRWQVRLFIDHPEALTPLRGMPGATLGVFDDEDMPVAALGTSETVPRANNLDMSIAGAVHVVPWPGDTASWQPGDIGDVVIEAFACTLPTGFVAAMVERATPPVWINLEYLSAEAWVPGCHLGRSPHPRLALTKTFFFPGVVEGTGGLLRERDLANARLRFLNDTQAQNALWSHLGVTSPPTAAQNVIITLFAYENSAVESLLEQWSDPALTQHDGAETITLIVPMGRVSPQVARYLGQSSLTVGSAIKRGRLTVHAVPFVSQDDYDRLLWLGDVNFVRGEDSFVRAQWAEQPFVWQIYPQSENTHLEKLDAALALYLAPLPEATRTAVQHFWHAWNAGTPQPASPEKPTDAPSTAPIDLSERWPASLAPSPTAADTIVSPDWIAFWQHHVVLRKHAAPWAAALQCPGSLSANLADFVESQLK